MTLSHVAVGRANNEAGSCQEEQEQSHRMGCRGAEVLQVETEANGLGDVHSEGDKLGQPRIPLQQVPRGKEGLEKGKEVGGAEERQTTRL